MPAASFHHVGFVVASIAESIEGFVRAVSAEGISAVFHDPIQKVRVAFVLPPAGGGPQIELVEPAAEKSPVTAFLARGGGLHHVCYEVDDLEGHIRFMREQRAAVLRAPQPAVAFQGRRIAWVLTREKLLVELLERVPLPPAD